MLRPRSCARLARWQAWQVEGVEELNACGQDVAPLLVRVAAGQEEQALELLRADPNVAYAERNGIVRAAQDVGDEVVPAEAGRRGDPVRDQ